MYVFLFLWFDFSLAIGLQYGVEIMVSEVLYKLLSTETQRRMRNLDKVLVKGSEQPMMLWSPSLGEPDGDGGNKFNRFTANYCSAVDSYCQGGWPAVRRLIHARCMYVCMSIVIARTTRCLYTFA